MILTALLRDIYLSVFSDKYSLFYKGNIGEMELCVKKKNTTM